MKTTDSFVFSDKGHQEGKAGRRELPDGMLYMLADGLHGEDSGALAARMVVETLAKQPYEAGTDAAAWLRECLHHAGQLLREGQRQYACPMESAAAALLVQGQNAYWVHSGNIRLYCLHDNQICAPVSPGNAALQPGDAFLLCTDGLRTYWQEEEVCIDLLKSRTARQWGELLLLRAMERLSPDSSSLSLLTVMTL